MDCALTLELPPLHLFPHPLSVANANSFKITFIIEGAPSAPGWQTSCLPYLAACPRTWSFYWLACGQIISFFQEKVSALKVFNVFILAFIMVYIVICSIILYLKSKIHQLYKTNIPRLILHQLNS